MPYQKTPHILYRVHIWTTTGPVEDVYILILEPCCYPMRRMHGAVVLLKDKVLIGINPSHWRAHHIFQDPNINARVQPLFHMEHYPRTNSRNPPPYVNRKATESFGRFNVAFIISAVSWSIHPNKTIVRRLEDLFVWEHNLAAAWFRSSVFLRRRREVLTEPGKLLIFTAAVAVVKGLFRITVKSCSFWLRIEIRRHPEPGRRSTVWSCLHFLIIALRYRASSYTQTFRNFRMW
jgi:hypothetical protein